MRTLARETILKDALYNCSTDCTQNGTESFDGITGLNAKQIYGQGIVNGAVAALMATGMDFAPALALVTYHMPSTFDGACLPKAWRAK